nr:putative ribonuclease H-like domain-containing protein [Tanacetum cinerariifolium]
MEAGTTATTLTAKLPILNLGEYDIWLMRIEQYFLMTDNSLWEVIKNGNKVLTKTIGTVEQPYEPTTVEEKLDKKNEIKDRGTLLMALPNKDQLKFHSYQDEKLLMEAIEKRYGGNKNPRSTNNTSSTNEADNTTYRVSIAHTQGNTINSTSVDILSDVVICAFLASLNSTTLSSSEIQSLVIEGLKLFFLTEQESTLESELEELLEDVSVISAKFIGCSSSAWLHMDLFGPTFVRSLNKKSYCLVITDYYSRFTWVFFLATKDETSPIIMTFTTGLENQLSLKVKVIKSDNGTAFKNFDLNQFYGMKGIKRKFSVPRTPQQNGIAERKNRTLIEAARTMLADSLLPIPFWTEAVNTACYVQNRVLETKLHKNIPYELLHGRPPSIGFMRPFGCLVTIFNTLDSLGKFKGKVDKGFLVGYSVNEKAREEINQQYVLFPVWSSGSINPQNYDRDAAFEGKEHDFDAKKPNNKVNAAGTIVTTVGQNSLNSTNPFSATGPLNTTASPTHGKSSFEDASQLPDDPDMPELENITYSDDENVVGAEADFNNLESSITISPIPTTRIHKHHPVKQKKDGIFISQDKYVAEILRKLGLTEGKSASTPIDTEKPLLKDLGGKDYKKQTVVSTSSIKAEYVAAASCCAQVLWIQNQLLDYGLQALVDKKKVVVTEAAIREVLWLDDAEGVDYLPNKEIFIELARIGKGFSRVETLLFEGILVGQEIEEGGDKEEHVEDVTAGDAAQGDDTATHGEVPIVSQEPSIPSPTPPTPLPQPPQDLPSKSQQKRRVKKLEKGNKVRVLKLRRLKRVGTSQRIDTSDDTVMDDESNQGRIIDEMDKDDVVALMVDKEEDKKDEEAKEDEPAKVQEVVDVVTTAKLIIEVVTTASEIVTAASTIISTVEPQVYDATITAALAKVVAAPSRRRKGVLIRDPKEESTTSSIILTETKSKDKGKGIMVEEPKPLKKKQQIEIDEEYARKLHAEINKDIEWDVAIYHVKL